MKAKRSINKTPWYMYMLGALMKTSEFIKISLMAIINHMTAILIIFAFVGMIIACQAMDNGTISFTVAMLFEVVLILFILALLKIKILECRGEKE